jgi:hypothetical protein
MNGLALFILVYETFKAPKVIFFICLPFLLLTVIGRLFIVMHWPFGSFLYLIPGLMTVGVLTYGIIVSKTDVVLKIIILLFPITRLMFRFTHFISFPFWLADFVVIGIITCFLTAKLLKRGN